ncbi:VC0807 family protein [Nonomuraea sp. NPDC000554]|uniref:VC0807 family protein n=1 Tax=Nonomuraea sp. NPDC000554 TaxID=3154259 RepID=UPI003330EBB8
MTNGPGSRIRPLLPLIIDVAVPVVLYLLLKQVGLDDFWALTVAGLATGVAVTVNTVRRRKMDLIGVLVVLEIVLSIVLLFVTDDPRIVAIKPSFYTALAGVFLGATCFVGRPVIYLTARPLATRGDPEREAAYEKAWRTSAPFRFRQRLMTATFALFLLVESVLRVIVVYRFTAAEIAESFLLSQLPGIVLFAAVLLSFRLQVPALRRIVNEIQESKKDGSLSPAGKEG